MRNLFAEYYKPTEEQFKTLWENCIFFVDANVLLNIYGYSDTTREQLIGLLERLTGRVRMTYQFALEYQRNRAHAIMEQVKNYAKVERSLKELQEQDFGSRTRHPFLSEQASVSLDLIRRELLEGRKKHESLFAEDQYAERINNLIASISPKPTEEELTKLHGAAKGRIASKTPPGYADAKEKGEPGCYGDFIGWRQLIDVAKAENKPAILITDDAKEDWWQMQGDRTIGPRPELVAEFMSECNTGFYMYSSGNFMRHAGKFLSQEVTESALQEVAARMQQQVDDSEHRKPEPKMSADESAPDKPLMPPDEPSAVEPKIGNPQSEINKKPETL